MKTINKLLISSLVLLPSAFAMGQQDPIRQPTVWGNDAKFLQEAVNGQLREIQFGRMAMEKGSDDFTRQYGDMLVKEHSLMLSDLRDIAMKKHVSVPQDVMEKDRNDWKSMDDKSGADWDSSFRNMMIMDHQKDLESFEMAAKKSSDSDIRAFVRKYTPHIKMHLKAAQDKRIPTVSELREMTRKEEMGESSKDHMMDGRDEMDNRRSNWNDAGSIMP